MSRNQTFAFLIAFVIVAWPGSMFFAYKQGRRDVLAGELKVYHINLKYRQDALGTNRQLHEFLKGRYYSVAAEISDGLPAAHAIDPGPTTNDILGNLVIGKTGESPASLYGIFVERSRKRKDGFQKY